MKLRIAIAADHGGYDLKQELVRRLTDAVDFVDLGAHSYDSSDDYPDFAIAAAQAVSSGDVERAVVICGSGVGASIACNKVKGVRAGLCHDTYSAHQGVEHDDMNALCMGARVIGVELATEIVAAFLMARFSAEERHLRRLDKIMALEQGSPPEEEDVEGPAAVEDEDGEGPADVEDEDDEGPADVDVNAD